MRADLLERAKKFQEGYKGLNMNRELDAEFKKLLERPSVPHLYERKVGEFEIKIDTILPLKKMTVVSARNWLLMGYKELECSFANPRPVYKLYHKGQLMMSDSPQEMFLQYDAYKNAKGRVLMGGLGLGMSATLFAEKEEVSEVVVIEKEKDVIKLCKPKNKKIKVINEDFWKYIKATKEKFDYIYVDIYYSTGCMEFVETVLPIRKILEKRFQSIPVDFWGEEEMKSQYDSKFDKSRGKYENI